MPRTPYTDDFITAARQVFIDGDMSMQKLADSSEELLGQEIGVDRLKQLSISDARGNWRVARQHQNALLAKDVSEEVESIRQLTYQQLIMSSTSGLYLQGKPGELEAVRQIVNDECPDIKIVNINPRGVEPALLNAYMNLLAKSKTPITSRVDARTELQKAMEVSRQAIKEL